MEMIKVTARLPEVESADSVGKARGKARSRLASDTRRGTTANSSEPSNAWKRRTDWAVLRDDGLSVLESVSTWSLEWIESRPSCLCANLSWITLHYPCL